jgi:hypothetical protein
MFGHISMEFNDTFLFLGKIDVNPVKNIIKNNNLNWDEFTDRQIKYLVHSNTKTIPIIFDKNFNFHSFKIHLTNLYSLFEDEILKIENIVRDNTNENGKIMRAILVNLPSGKSIPSHVDRGPSLINCRRIHIPIETNENCFFTVGDDKRNLKLGEMWEINNDKKKHSVDNFGDNDRIHLIVDWVESSLLEL